MSFHTSLRYFDDLPKKLPSDSASRGWQRLSVLTLNSTARVFGALTKTFWLSLAFSRKQELPHQSALATLFANTFFVIRSHLIGMESRTVFCKTKRVRRLTLYGVPVARRKADGGFSFHPVARAYAPYRKLLIIEKNQRPKLVAGEGFEPPTFRL